MRREPPATELVRALAVLALCGAAEEAGRAAVDEARRAYHTREENEESRDEFFARFDRALRRQGVRLPPKEEA